MSAPITYEYAKGWNAAVEEMAAIAPTKLTLKESGHPTDAAELEWLERALKAEFGEDLRDLLRVFVAELCNGMGGNAIVGRYQTLGDIRRAFGQLQQAFDQLVQTLVAQQTEIIKMVPDGDRLEREEMPGGFEIVRYKEPE